MMMVSIRYAAKNEAMEASYDMNLHQNGDWIHSCSTPPPASSSPNPKYQVQMVAAPVPGISLAALHAYLQIQSNTLDAIFVFIASGNPHHAIGKKSNRKQNGNQLKQSSECIFFI